MPNVARRSEVISANFSAQGHLSGSSPEPGVVNKKRHGHGSCPEQMGSFITEKSLSPHMEGIIRAPTSKGSCGD